MNESCHTYEWAMSHRCMSHATHMNESCHTYESVMSHTWTSNRHKPQNDSILAYPFCGLKITPFLRIHEGDTWLYSQKDSIRGEARDK